jgi:hypothetical protein
VALFLKGGSFKMYDFTPKSKYVVTKDNPFYNSVEYCETLGQAQTMKKDWFEDMNDAGGSYKCHITIAQIVETIPFESHY